MPQFLFHDNSSGATGGHAYPQRFQPQQLLHLNGQVGSHREFSATTSSQDRVSHSSPMLHVHQNIFEKREKALNPAKYQVLSYHGAGPLLHEARKIIAETAIGEGRLMSARMMMDTLRARGNILCSKNC
jgi:hypothetical protein